MSAVRQEMMMNGNTVVMLMAAAAMLAARGAVLEEDIDACLWRAGAEGMQRCEEILRRYSSNELAVAQVDGCSAWLVVHGRKAELHAARGEHTLTLRHGQAALAHAAHAMSPERVMWIVYLCAMAAGHCTNGSVLADMYWSQLQGFVEQNEDMAGIVARHTAGVLLAQHATNAALSVLAAACTRVSYLDHTLVIRYAHLLHDTEQYDSAFEQWLEIARQYALHEEGRIVREAFIVLDNLAPYVPERQITRYAALRSRLPARFPASARYTAPIARFMALRASEAANNELLLRELEAAGTRCSVHAVTQFVATLDVARYCADDTYGDGHAVLFNHRSRAAWLAGRILCEQGARADGAEMWLRTLEERANLCMDASGALLLITGVYEHAGLLTPAQSNRFAGALATCAQRADEAAARRVAAFGNYGTRDRARYAARVQPVLRHVHAALAQRPPGSPERQHADPPTSQLR